MKKIIGIVMVVFLLLAVSAGAVDFGEADYKVMYSPQDKTLTIAGKYVTLSIDSQTGSVSKLIPETWKPISSPYNISSLTAFTSTITGTTSYFSILGPSLPKESYKVRREEIGPFTVTYETPEKVLIIQGTILKYFFLRVHNCGQVEKMEWREINKNER